MPTRQDYFKDYYQKKKDILQNRSLIHNHKKRLLKEPNLKQSIEQLLYFNKNRRQTCRIQKIIKTTTIYFD